MPDTERVRRALSQVEVLVVADVVESEITDLATHLAPCAGQLERADVTLGVDQYLPAVVAQYTPAVVKPATWSSPPRARRSHSPRSSGVSRRSPVVPSGCLG
jgi:anaerobic selenocysteine-containing dehydrogenase